MAEKIEIGDEMKEVLNQDPVEKPAESTGVEAAAAEAKEGEAGEEKAGEPSQETPEQQAERRNRVSAKERIRQFRIKAGDAERRAEAAERELEKLRNGGQPESKEPKRESYQTDDDYLEAVVDYRAEQKAQNKLREKEQEFIQRKQQEKAAENRTRWAKQQEKALQRDPDFLDIEQEFIEEVQDIGAVNLFDDLLDSDKGAELIVYFHKNPGELERVASLRPSAASREIGKLESKLASGPAKKPAPPPPPETIRGSATVTKDISKMSQAEYNRYKNGLA